MSKHSSDGFERREISFSLNGKQVQIETHPWVTALDLLREQLDLTGSKKGCDHGQCGACTVLLDGRRVNACLTLAVMLDGRELITVEGLSQNGELHPMQRAFIEQDAFQCGYCTPGQICSAVGMIAEGRIDDKAAMRERMSGNLCRCGAYSNILAAIEQALPECSEVRRP